MPIYEYACRTCAHSFETLVRGGEEPNCPHCHGADRERPWGLAVRPLR